MTVKIPPIPEWMQHEIRLDDLEEEFYDQVLSLQSLRIETREEALNHSLDRSCGLVVQYRRSDIDDLDFYLNMALSIEADLRQMFAERQVTAKLMRYWGNFMYCVGIVDCSYFANGDDLGPLRAGMAGGKAKCKKSQQQWFAHLMHPLLNEGMNKKAALHKVLDHIKGVIASQDMPSGFKAKWFKDMLISVEGRPDYYDSLKNPYQRMTKSRVEELVRENPDRVGLPPV